MPSANWRTVAPGYSLQVLARSSLWAFRFSEGVLWTIPLPLPSLNSLVPSRATASSRGTTESFD